MFERLYLGMRNGMLILLVLLSGFGCSQKRRTLKTAEALSKCENSWRYFKLTQPIKGVVLLHSKGYCGYAHVHANTIIIINNTDTIRVNGPCYTANTITSDSVLVSPYETDNVIGAIGDTKYDCTIKKTCYGIITKIKKQ